MNWPLIEVLNFIEPHLPDQLVPAQALAQARTLADLLPPAMSAHYFECRLGATGHQVDFSTCIAVVRGDREIYNAPETLQKLADFSRQDQRWGRILEFFQTWAEPTSILYETVPLVWLEFDQLEQPLRPAPLPGVNICLDRTYLQRTPTSPSSTTLSPEDIQNTLEGLLGQPVPLCTQQNSLTCFEMLPADSKILYLSVMLSRQPATIKLNGIIPKNKLLDYLSAILWPGSILELTQLLHTFGPTIEYIRFDLTIGDEISSRLGLELFSKGLDQDQAKRQTLINQLMNHDLCTPAKGAALLNWAGFSREMFARHTRPTRLERAWYVKLVVQTNHPLEAKGYLGFTPNYITPFSLI